MTERRDRFPVSDVSRAPILLFHCQRDTHEMICCKMYPNIAALSTDQRSCKNFHFFGRSLLIYARDGTILRTEMTHGDFRLSLPYRTDRCSPLRPCATFCATLTGRLVFGQFLVIAARTFVYERSRTYLRRAMRRKKTR